MSNSSLVNYVKWSPNHSGRRTHSIDTITPHCVVGQCSVETLGNIFVNPSAGSSCQYGIGVDGRVGQYVKEENRSWCSSSNANDQRAITIECASDTYEPYAFKPAVYNKLIDLCVDICQRYGKTKLIWFGDKNKTLNYNPKPNEMVITVHRWFANKSCPGDWLYSRLGDLASKVTKRLEEEEEVTYEQFVDFMKKYEKEQAQKPAANWAKPAIEVCNEEGIMVGDAEGNFRAQSYITRQEIAQVAKNLLDKM